MPTREDAARVRQGRDYLKAWDALGQLLLEGRSWSGHEANMAFLNLGNGAFSPCAAVAGLNLVADSRGVAATDWDRDGDLDLWFTHRTGPRVSFLENRSPDSGRSVSLRLQGVRSNRDAIGARVSVRLKGRVTRLLRSLRAGEGYLSQASKTMIIGLPADVEIEGVDVVWPDGVREAFSGVSAGGRFRLLEGRGRAESMKPLAVVKAEAAALRTPAGERPMTTGRIIPHAPLPLPAMPHTFGNGEAGKLVDIQEPTLVVLWAPWCQPCLRELEALAKEADTLEESGLAVLCLNVDREADPSNGAEVRPAFLPASFLTASGGQDFLEQLDVVQRALISPEPGLALPTSFLLDAQGRLRVYYRGPVTPSQVMQDHRGSVSPDGTQRDLAIPFPGTWLMARLPPDLLAIPERLTAIGRAVDAFDYLERHVTKGRVPKDPSELPSSALTLESVSRIYFRIGEELQKQKATALMRRAWERAVAYAPQSIERRAALAMHYEGTGEWALSAGHYRAVLEQAPGHLAAGNSLAWILATAADPALRQPDEAIRLAYAVCQATEMNQPEPLDTLGGALAAAGRFDEAIRAVERGIALAERSDRQDVIPAMRRRLELFRAGQPFVQARGISAGEP